MHIGQQLSQVAAPSAWSLGDWLIYGETFYNGRYHDAIEQTSLDYQTLRNYAWVARRFQLSRRRDGLSFGHHAEVASLPEPEQDFWLRKAEEFGWSRNQMRRVVRASLRERSAEGGRAQIASGERRPDENHRASDANHANHANHARRIEIAVTAEQLQLVELAARSEGLSIEVWAALAIYQVARRRLDSASPPVGELGTLHTAGCAGQHA